MKTILVPTDFSENSLQALQEAILIARLLKSKLVLVHALETYMLNSALKSILGNDPTDSFRSEAATKLAELAEEISIKHAVTVEYAIEKGKIYQVIIEIAKKQNADLIVMGTNGITGVGDYFLGTNAVNVVKQALCPVITYRKPLDHLGYRNIVLPLDLTKETKLKVKLAIDLGKLFNATIHVISVLMTVDHKIKMLLEYQMDDVVNQIEEAGITCVAAIMERDNIVEAILEYASLEDVNADLIAIMISAENEKTPFFMGSQAQRVINTAQIPVLSIRPTNHLAE